MTCDRQRKVWAFLLGMLLFCAAPADASLLAGASVASSRVFRPQQSPQESAQVLQSLAQANVVYLAETHDRPQDHQLQLQIIQALHSVQPKLIVAMEMFQRPYQTALDRYLTGQITERELQGLAQYQKRWGFPWEFYAPILQFAKANRLPVIALNTPSEVTRKVARTGWASLTVADRQWIPPQSAVFNGPPAYRQRLRQFFEQMHQGKSNSSSFDRFFEAQVLWDETMAEAIARQVKQQPDALIVVLVGQGHVVYRDGIPSRVLRRVQSMRLPQPFQQISVVLNPTEELQAEPNPTIADYFWTSP